MMATEPINLIVIVQEQPTAVTNCNSSSPVTVKEGDHFECLCNSTGGNPPPTASWYKDGNLVSGPGYLKTTLSLKNIAANDRGIYSCVVESHDLNDKKKVEIGVLLKPIAMTNCSTSVTVNEGDDLECLCYDTRGNPSPTALWYKDGNNIGEPRYLKKILSLKSISAEDAGNYSCLVNNTVFEDVKKIEIQVHYIKPTIVLFQTGNHNKYNVIVGENMTITCKAEGFPPPDYIIFHNGTQLADVVNGVRSIKSVQRSDDGQYECIAKNILGNVSANFNLIVQERPTAEINCSSPFTVKENDNFVCLCYSSAGYPSPNATWYNSDGNKVGKTESLKKTLLLKNITKEEAGNYSCIVKSLDFEDTKQVKLQVQYKPKIISFKSGKENNTIPVGGNVTITCKAEAFRPQNYTIYHNGIRLTDVVNGVKTIKSVDHNDGGRYECVAINNLGNVYASFNLIVQGKPSNITFCFTKPNDKDITLTCKASSVPPPTYTITLNDKTLTNVVEGTTTISNYREHGIGVYSCEAENKMGKVSIVLLAAKGDSNSDTKWYFIVIALICGIFFGIIFLYTIQSLRQRFKSKKDNSIPAHNYDTPETHPEGAADNSAYQELELRNREPENSYQALRMNTRRRINNETKTEDEANYQELDKVREKENSYQSLNRV